MAYIALGLGDDDMWLLRAGGLVVIARMLRRSSDSVSEVEE